MTNTLPEARCLIELEYDMVSQPHATIKVGPSLKEELTVMFTAYTIFRKTRETIFFMSIIENIIKQPENKIYC